MAGRLLLIICSMIAKDYLTELKTKWQTTELNTYREYLQHLFLNFLYQEKEARHLIFKGGTALRLVHGSPRFSEDLDFDGQGISCNDIEDLWQESLVGFVKEGMQVEIQESTKTSGGCLGIFEIAVYSLKIPLQIEVSLRKGMKVISSKLVTVGSPFLPDYPVFVLNDNDLVAEKIEAFLTRQKPRDFFDIYILLRHGLGQQQIAKKSKEIMTLLEKVEPMVIRRDLKPLLPKNFHPILADFKGSLSKELERASVTL